MRKSNKTETRSICNDKLILHMCFHLNFRVVSLVQNFIPKLIGLFFSTFFTSDLIILNCQAFPGISAIIHIIAVRHGAVVEKFISQAWSCLKLLSESGLEFNDTCSVSVNLYLLSTEITSDERCCCFSCQQIIYLLHRGVFGSL